jgi:hypothetical protein
MSQVVTVRGTVTRLDWANPHVYLYVAQESETGETVEWAVETYPPAAMRRTGWSAETLRPGEVVSVTGNPTRRAENAGIFPATIEAAGRTLFQSATVLQQMSRTRVEPQLGAPGVDGIWETLADVELYVYFYATRMRLTEAGTAAQQSYDEATMLPARDCIPYSEPLLMIDPDFKQITTDDDVITIRSGFAPAERTIHMNTASHAGPSVSDRPALQGRSIGRWEGDTLVIDTTDFAPHRIGNGYRGLPSGPQKHLVERLTLHEDGKRLSYAFELTDPEFLAETVTGEIEWGYRPDLEFVREPCELDNARRFSED